MDTMLINTWIFRAIIQKVLRHVFKKNFNLDINIRIDSLEMSNNEDGEMVIKTTMEATGDSREILNLITERLGE